MKLLHIISSLQRGGAEHLLFQHVCSLQKRSINQSVLYFHEGPYSILLGEQNIAVRKIEGFFCKYDPLFWWRLYRAIKEQQTDVIHSWLWSANAASCIIGWLFKIPVIISLHNNIDQNGWLRTLCDSIVVGFATKIICVSQGIYDSLPSLYRSHKEKILVINNGIALLTSCTPMRRSDIGLDTSHIIIGSVGRFVSLKNYPLLIKAFALLTKYYPQTRLVLLGTGPEEQRLRELVKALDIHHKVVFIINQPAMHYYPLFDCFCLSSYKEGISIALLEALSHQLCCVITSATLSHDVIKHNDNGIVVNSYEPYALLKSLERVVNNQAMRVDLAKQGYNTVKNSFNLERMSQEYIKIYKNYVK